MSGQYSRTPSRTRRTDSITASEHTQAHHFAAAPAARQREEDATTYAAQVLEPPGCPPHRSSGGGVSAEKPENAFHGQVDVTAVMECSGRGGAGPPDAKRGKEVRFADPAHRTPYPNKVSNSSGVNGNRTGSGHNLLQQEQQKKTPRRLRVDLFEDSDDIGCCGRGAMVLRNTWSSLTRLRLVATLTWVDFRARKGSYALSFCSVFFVVTLCVAMLSVLSSIPAVFLRLAEPSVGQADLILTAGGQLRSGASLNYTAIRQLLAAGEGEDNSQQRHAARVEVQAYAFTPRRCRTHHAMDLWFPFPQEKQPAAAGGGPRTVCHDTCYEQWCETSVGPVVTLYALDTDREDAMGFAPYRDFPWRTPEKGFAIISSNVASDLQVGPGEDVFFVLPGLDDTLTEFFALTPVAGRSYNAVLKLRVQAVVTPYSYKFPDTNSFVMVNYADMNRIFASGLSPQWDSSIAETVASVDPRECAGLVLFNLPPGDKRRTAYQAQSYEAVRRRVMDWATPIPTRIGFNQVSSSAVLVADMYSTRVLRILVNLILVIIMVAIAALSLMLVYSLMTVGIESRTYELGIQRMIGFNRENLVTSVLWNAYFFAIPAWLAGLGAGQGVYILVRYVFHLLIDIDIPLAVSGESIGWATFAAFVTPLVASILPIREMITLPLPEALDSTRSRGKGVVYTIVCGGREQLNGMMLGLGLLYGLSGFLLYTSSPRASSRWTCRRCSTFSSWCCSACSSASSSSRPTSSASSRWCSCTSSSSGSPGPSSEWSTRASPRTACETARRASCTPCRSPSSSSSLSPFRWSCWHCSTTWPSCLARTCASV